MHRLILLGATESHRDSVQSNVTATASATFARRSQPRLSRKPSNQLSPLSLRPHVLARNRIRSWQTPYGCHVIRSLSQSFPAALVERWQDVLAQSVEESTRAGYGAGLLRFNHFCDLHRIPEVDRMPASEALLSMFVSSYGAGRVAAGTVSTWLAGLQLWHAVNLAPWDGASLLARTRKGVAKLAPSSSVRPPRDPVTENHMHELRSVLDLTNSRDSAVWAVACVAWRGCCRLGELLCNSDSTFDPSRHVERGCKVKRGHAENGHQFITFKIPWSKTRRSLGDWISLTQTADDVDAISAFEHHLFVNSTVPTTAPLFAFCTAEGWSKSTRFQTVSRVCFDADAIGLKFGFSEGAM
ncbi:hypothetical protein FB45DRAFT_889763 [Roridomyces roridus]|uniref:Uncharacterized protein n=1 Tax=Roridomyces roridus TaxID=1738132 RepID=A0AAD7CKK6_9AGAR|nr:hypothetical protein FB45DRAFT_889763 [Roridomyces roridus]